MRPASGLYAAWRDYSRDLNAPDSLIVPTLVQHELYQWLCREIGQPVALSAIAATQTAIVVSLDTSIALLAADIAKAFKLATADAIIYATAHRHRATLVTGDAHFSVLPQVGFLPKSGKG